MFPSRLIVYFAVLLDGPNSGVGKKVLDQAAVWRELGMETRIFLVSDKSHFTEWSKFENVVVFQEVNGVRKLQLRRNILKEALEAKPDVLYIRDSFPFIIPRIPTNSSLVLEVQTLLQQELFSRNKLRGIQSIILDFFFLPKFSKYVFVSSEISKSKRFKRYLNSENSRVISNGIRFERIPEINVERAKVPFEFLFLGQDGQPWHGVQQIIELSRVMPDVIFNIVGIKKSVDEVSSNVIFHGILDQSEYVFLAKKCVLGIGSLNLSAKKMTEGSSLKVREYLAMGLPVVLRHKDTDFSDQFEHILELPNNQEPITSFKDDILSFAEKWQARRVPREFIKHVEMKFKEAERIKFVFQESS